MYYKHDNATTVSHPTPPRSTVPIITLTDDNGSGLLSSSACWSCAASAPSPSSLGSNDSDRLPMPLLPRAAVGVTDLMVWLRRARRMVVDICYVIICHIRSYHLISYPHFGRDVGPVGVCLSSSNELFT